MGLPETPRAADVVGAGEGKQDDEREESRADSEFDQLGTVLDMHKEQYDQRALDDRDSQRNDCVEDAEFHARGVSGESGKDEERSEDEGIDLGADNCV